MKAVQYSSSMRERVENLFLSPSQCKRFKCIYWMGCKAFALDYYTSDCSRCEFLQISPGFITLSAARRDIMYSQDTAITSPGSFYSLHIEHLLHSSCVYLSPVEWSNSKPYWSPGKGPGKFMETNMTNLRDADRPTLSGEECVRHIFMDNHFEVQWMVYNEHGELYILYQ